MKNMALAIFTAAALFVAATMVRIPSVPNQSSTAQSRPEIGKVALASTGSEAVASQTPISTDSSDRPTDGPVTDANYSDRDREVRSERRRERPDRPTRETTLN
jgi:hypothetical protein